MAATLDEPNRSWPRCCAPIQVSAADFENVQLTLSADGRVHGVLAKAVPVDGEAKPKPVRYAIASTDGGEVEPFLALVPNPIQPNRVVPCTPAAPLGTPARRSVALTTAAVALAPLFCRSQLRRSFASSR